MQSRSVRKFKDVRIETLYRELANVAPEDVEKQIQAGPGKCYTKLRALTKVHAGIADRAEKRPLHLVPSTPFAVGTRRKHYRRASKPKR